MRRRHLQLDLTPLFSVSLLLLSACGETIDPTEGGFGDVASFSGGAGTDSTSTGNDPMEPGELEPGECIADEKEDVYGYKYQCGGYFMAHVGFVYDGDPYAIYIPTLGQTHFGDEPYEDAKVIACCGPADPTLDAWDQPATVLESCMLDFRQQACISMATSLAAMINDGTVPDIYKAKAIDIQNYLAQNTDECIAGFLPDMSDYPWFLEEARWDLPAEGPWSPQLSNVYIEVNFMLLNDLQIPEQPEVCPSLNINNDDLFTPPPMPLINVFDVDLDEGGGGIFGPNRISGSTTFASLATGCSEPRCSYASFSTDGVEFAIDRMQLFVDGDLRVNNGIDSEVISNARLELYHQAHGTITGGGREPIQQSIPPGHAQFLVVGQAADEWVTIPVLTSTPIVARETSGTWTVDAFALEYMDDMGNTWSLRVDASDWL